MITIDRFKEYCPPIRVKINNKIVKAWPFNRREHIAKLFIPDFHVIKLYTWDKLCEYFNLDKILEVEV